MFFILVVLIALNELGRETKWGGILLFVIVPVVLTIFVWPTTCAPGNETEPETGSTGQRLTLHLQVVLVSC